MPVDAISNSTNTNGTYSSNSLKTDFLQILVAELKNQNPLEPMDNTEYITQLAQFSMLDSINLINQANNEIKGINMIGKQVAAQVYDEESESSVICTGTVKSVIFNNGKVYVNTGDNILDIDNISEVFIVDDTDTGSGQE